MLEKLDLPKWVHFLLKLYHENCWVPHGTDPKKRKVATTRRGSKQGSILGGVLFELWMDEALCEMDDEEEDETELW